MTGFPPLFVFLLKMRASKADFLLQTSANSLGPVPPCQPTRAPWASCAKHGSCRNGERHVGHKSCDRGDEEKHFKYLPFSFNPMLSLKSFSASQPTVCCHHLYSHHFTAFFRVTAFLLRPSMSCSLPVPILLVTGGCLFVGFYWSCDSSLCCFHLHLIKRTSAVVMTQRSFAFL